MNMRKMDDSNETAPGHHVDTDDEGRKLYRVPEGWIPVGQYELNEEGLAYEING